LAENTNAELDAISFLFTAHALGYMLGSFFGGRLYDRMPGHPLMAGMLVLMAAMLALVPLAPALWMLTAVWLLLGIGGGALDVGGNTLLVWVHGRKVGPFMNALHFFFGIGSFLAPVVVAVSLTLSGNVTAAFWFLAVLVLPVALWLIRLPSPSPPDETPSLSQGSISSAERAQLEAGSGKTALLIALLLLFYVGAEAAFAGWIPTYAVALNLGGATTAAYLASAFWGALTFGRLASIPIAARVRPAPPDIACRSARLPGERGRDPALVLFCHRRLAGRTRVGALHGFSLSHCHLPGRAADPDHRPGDWLVLGS